MKKLFLMMVFSLSIGLTACGSGSTDTEQQVQENEQTQENEQAQENEQTENTEQNSEAVGSEGNAAGQENGETTEDMKEASELNESDYQQLSSLMETVQVFAEEFVTDNAAMTEQIKNGTAKKNKCLKKYKAYVKEANAIMEQLDAAEWKTEDCKQHLTLLAQGLSSLRAGGELCIQAVELENVELITVAEPYFTTYTECIDSLHEALGI